MVALVDKKVVRNISVTANSNVDTIIEYEVFE